MLKRVRIRQKIVLLNPYGGLDTNSISKVCGVYISALKEQYDITVLTYDAPDAKDPYVSLFATKGSFLFKLYSLVPGRVKRIIKKRLLTTRLDLIMFWVHANRYLSQHNDIAAVIVHGFPSYLFYIHKLKHKYKVIFHLHGSSLNLFSPMTEKQILDRVDGVICLNQELVDKCTSTHQFHNVWHIPNTIAECVATHKKEEGTFIYAGRIVPDKKVIELCESFVRVFQNHNGASKLVLAGPFFDEVYKRDFMKVVESSRGLLEYRGHLSRPEMEKEYSRSEYVVLLSNSEGSPLCLLEGISHGCKLISSDITGCREIIKAFGGYLVDNNEMDVSLTSILNAIKNNESAQRFIKPDQEGQHDFSLESYRFRLNSMLGCTLQSTSDQVH